VESIVIGKEEMRPTIETRIAVPREIDELRRDDPAKARDIQQSISNKFLECFERGLTCVGFEMSDAAGTYLLAEWRP
jgi:hypothetical protein